jgi:cholesterol oxidase
MTNRMRHRRRLSRSLSLISPSYDVVIVGSGYGGSIMASRLARAGKRVCLLERGREIVPGEYPDTEKAAASEMQVDLEGSHVGSRTAMFDLRRNDDISVLLGCGLGGTSLINANVSLPAENAVFDDPAWPAELRGSAGAESLMPYYERARAMLKPKTYPEGTVGYPELLKVIANRQAGKALGEDVNLTPINVNFESFADGRNHVGVEQPPCTNCGDCCSGCNYGSKNTVLMNYLPDAYNHGAEIYTEAAVRHVRKQPDSDRWIVYFAPIELGRERFSAPPMFVTADVVVLSAGALGSTELLMRSAKHGLPVSTKLGSQFTGNGDVLGFAYNCSDPINGVGAGNGKPDLEQPPGPCITSVIDARNKPHLDDGMVIEEGVIPGALDDVLSVALHAGEAFVGQDTGSRPGIRSWLAAKWRKIKDFFASLVGSGAYVGAVRHTQTMLVMAHDGSDGQMKLKDDKLRIDWPGVGDREEIKTVNQRLYDVAAALKGTFIRNPVWSKAFGRELVTVHPLGGCCMGDQAASGVVNHCGGVFTGEGATTHSGLYVADGAIVPRSLGVNPLLTISALAERNAELIAAERGWTIDDSENRPDAAPGVEYCPGVRFTESMAGFVTPELDADTNAEQLDVYRAAEKRGRDAGTAFRFILTVDGNEIDRFIEDPKHESGIFGTVSCSLLSAQPLVATQGQFNLFASDPDRVETREMLYAMTLTAIDGEQHYFEGFKRIHDDRGFDVWSDTTTLYVTIYQGTDNSGSVVARGILHIAPSDLAHQLRTITTTHADEKDESLKTLAKFSSLFAGCVFDNFGKGLGKDYLFDPDVERERRPLRVGQPIVYPVETADGVIVRLTRYQGGDKGPVILAHGLGVSSLIFSIDTIETNLLEFLYEQGYDVWLLDYRVSIDLNSSQEAYNGDHVAKLDYPAAIDKVRELTGRDSVQVVSHCYGATTFTMAALSGLQGVRSAVLSQVCTDVESGLLTDIKAGLYIPEVLDRLGVDSMTAYVDQNRGWLDTLYDTALKLFYPIQGEERARSPVHRRITFLYGTLYELDQLNDATFKALHEMFGIANIAALEHLATIVRAGKVVNAQGEDVYVQNADNWNFPTRIIHGAENACFLPVSTERAIARLQAANGNVEFSRKVIPEYGHIDCIYGKNAARDVYPHILEHLEQTATS